VHVLLLGAGFTRNWGGWLASELVGDLLGRVAGDPELHLMLQASRGDFEGVLGVVQQEHSRDPSARNKDRVERLQSAILASFQEMNGAIAARASMEFSGGYNLELKRFMMLFDAIFSLNQDLLLELHYATRSFDGSKFTGFQFPGMEAPSRWVESDPRVRLARADQWTQAPRVLAPEMQPIFKLHGSTNWRDAAHGDMLVMGTQKQAIIERSELLRWYFDKFHDALHAGDTKVMVIGYSFRDEHINEELRSAGATGLQMFIVDPVGSDNFYSPAVAAIRVAHPLADVPRIGESRRPLSTTFGGDTLERGKLFRFFN
jgi:hypothetical protein